MTEGVVRMGWYEEWRRHLRLASDLWVDRSLDHYRVFEEKDRSAMMRKKRLLKERKAEIVKASAAGAVTGMHWSGAARVVRYRLRQQFLIKHRDVFYLEERQTDRQAVFNGDELVRDRSVTVEPEVKARSAEIPDPDEGRLRAKGKGFDYDRLSAVKYADRWWCDANPEYKAFDVDCTNFVSQCLRAGGAPMHGQFNPGAGWWYANHRWSFSWTVAHALRWYFEGESQRMGAVSVDRPERLQPGDVICYDFQGDGRFDHSTIVTAKDADGMPLVNAHTTDSRHRYWSYEDSTAWTPNIKYKFFHIGGD